MECRLASGITSQLSHLPPSFTTSQLLAVEADCYWCLCKLLDGIQDHYTHAQPGIQRTVFHLRELVRWVAREGWAHRSWRRCSRAAPWPMNFPPDFS